MTDIEPFLAIHIGQYHYTSFQVVDNLPRYIDAYRKGKSFDDLTLVRNFILEDINQSAHCMLVVISGDEDFFERITLEV